MHNIINAVKIVYNIPVPKAFSSGVAAKDIIEDAIDLKKLYTDIAEAPLPGKASIKYVDDPLNTIYAPNPTIN